MDSYLLLVFLSYFYYSQENYVFEDVKRIMGLSQEAFDLYFNKLQNEEFLYYINSMLKVSEKGVKLLRKEKIENYFSEEILSNEFKLNSFIAKSVFDPYVPKEFSSKFKLRNRNPNH